MEIQLDDYVKASRTAEAREGVKKSKPKTELPKTDWRRIVSSRARKGEGKNQT